MSWLEPTPTDAQLVAHVRDQSPDVLELAQHLAPALRIEPRLLRNARLTYLPDSDAGLEAAVWQCPLVESRSTRGLTLKSGVARLLTELLADNPAEFDANIALIEANTAHWPARERLEQSLRLDARDPNTPAAVIREKLQKVLREIMHTAEPDQRSEIARWAKGALPGMIGADQSSPEAYWLSQFAAATLGDPGGALTRQWKDRCPMPGWLVEKTPLRRGVHRLGLRWRPGVLEFLPADQSRYVIDTGAPFPAPIFLSCEGSDEPDRWELVWPDHRLTLPSECTSLLIQSITGVAYQLSLRGTGTSTKKQEAPRDDAEQTILAYAKSDERQARQIAEALSRSGLRVDLALNAEIAALSSRVSDTAKIIQLWTRRTAGDWKRYEKDENFTSRPRIWLRIDRGIRTPQEAPKSKGLTSTKTTRTESHVLDWYDWRKETEVPEAASRIAQKIEGWLEIGSAGDRVFRTMDLLNVRHGPGTRFDKVPGSPLKKGVAVEVSQRQGEWWFVKAVSPGDDGQTVEGWVYSAFLEYVADGTVDWRSATETTEPSAQAFQSEQRWLEFAATHTIGDRLTGTVSESLTDALLIDLSGGVQGLLHFGDLAEANTRKRFQSGESVDVVILKVDPEDQTIRLGQKQLDWPGRKEGQRIERLYVSTSGSTMENRRWLEVFYDGLREALPDVEIMGSDQVMIEGIAWRDHLMQWLAECDAAVVILFSEALAKEWFGKELAVLDWRRRLDPSFLLLPIGIGFEDVSPEMIVESPQLRDLEIAADELIQVGSPSELVERTSEQIRRANEVNDLLREIDKNDTGPERRLEIGDRLAEIGDARRGVGLDDSGLPDIDWVEIPAGPFLYGEDKRRELPNFSIARYPVTNAQYQAFIDDGGYADKRWWDGLAERIEQPQDPGWTEANRPRERVSWYEAMAFCRWLSDRLGYEIRLPTEFKWEKAARGTDGREYPWGDSYRPGYANINEKRTDAGPTYLAQTTAVGLYPHGASPYGVEDLTGNVWEWCLNKYEDPESTDPGGKAPRALRGGSWGSSPDLARASDRYRRYPVNRFDLIFGFRVMCSSPIDR